MKSNRWLSMALVVALAGSVGASLALAETTETTTTTTYSGTMRELAPSTSSFIIESNNVPRTYTYTKKTVFLDASGNVVAADVTRGQPVTVYYHPEGQTMVVDKVIETRPAGSVTEHTTETRREEVR